MLEKLLECCTDLVQEVKARMDLVPENAAGLDELAGRVQRIWTLWNPSK